MSSGPHPEPLPTDEPGEGTAPPRAGARRRRRQASVVVAVAVASAVTGVLVGSQLKSPAERAADRAAPRASRITVPVERRQLTSTLTLSGEIRYDEPTTVRIVGDVGASAGQRQVITRAPTAGEPVTEGSVLAEISGRPVFAFLGMLPVFRSFGPGITGPDVEQLEAALSRLGYDPGPIDGIYDEATETAIDALYADHGYQSEGPTDEQRKALRGAESAVADAEKNLASAKNELAKANEPRSTVDKLEAQQQLDAATAAVPEAEAAAKRANDDAAGAVSTTTGVRDQARAGRDATKAIVAAATIAGAINPETGAEYSPIEIETLRATLADKETALLNAEAELGKAISTQADVAANGVKSVKQAKDALVIAQARFAELAKPADTTSLVEAVAAAQGLLDQAKFDRLAAQIESGTKFPSGEMVFLPVLPSTVTAVAVKPGDAIPGEGIATVSSTQTSIVARISKADAALVSSGTKVDITLRDADITTTGTITSIGEPSTDTQQPGGGEFPPTAPSGSGSSGRLQVVVVPDDPTLLADWVGMGVRVVASVSSTDGEVLAVPVAAVFVGPDGTSQVEVERAPATDDDPGRTEVVGVTVGLAAQGLAEITPLGGAPIAEGDRVVVGVRSSATGSTTGAQPEATSGTTP